MDYIEELEKQKKQNLIKQRLKAGNGQSQSGPKNSHQLQHEQRVASKELEKKLQSKGIQQQQQKARVGTSLDKKREFVNEAEARKDKWESDRKQIKDTRDMLQRGRDLQREEVTNNPPRKEMSEADKQRYLEMLEMNANIGLLLNQGNKKETKPSNQGQEYDPSGFGRQETPKNLVSEIDRNLRQELKMQDNLEVISKQVQIQREKALQEQQRLQRIREDEQKKAKLLQRMKQMQAQEPLKPKMKSQNQNPKSKEAKNLEHKLLKKREYKQENKQNIKQIKNDKVAQIWCARCHKMHDKDLHKSKVSKNDDRNNGNQILTKIDSEMREVKQAVNILNVNPQSKSGQKNQSQVNRVTPIQQQRAIDKPNTHRVSERPQNQQSMRPPNGNNRNDIRRQDNRKHDQRHQVPINRNDQMRRQKGGKRDEYEEESDLSDFIVKDDDVEEYDPLDPVGNRQQVSEMIQKLFRKNHAQNNYDYDDEDDYSSNMEAGYDDIEEEERRTARIARREDAEQLKLIQMEEQREKQRKKKKRAMYD